MNKIIGVILIVLIIMCCGACKSSYKKSQKSSKNEKVDLLSTIIYGKVLKIDSLNKIYIVYVSENDYSYKILSKKGTLYSCNKIEIDSSYLFKVNQLTNGLAINNDSTSLPVPINYLDIQRCIYYENHKVCTEPKITQIYSATNLKGLCFIRSTDLN